MGTLSAAMRPKAVLAALKLTALFLSSLAKLKRWSGFLGAALYFASYSVHRAPQSTAGTVEAAESPTVSAPLVSGDSATDRFLFQSMNSGLTSPYLKEYCFISQNFTT